MLGAAGPRPRPASDPACNAAGAGFNDTIGSTATATAAAARLRPKLNASYTDSAYWGATWQVNICDDVAGVDGLERHAAQQQDLGPNGNDMVWVRAQSVVAGKTRAVVGLVRVRTPPALNVRYGLVAGNVSDDLGPVTSALTNASVLSGVTAGLLDADPPVAPDLRRIRCPRPASRACAVGCSTS